MMVVCVVDLHFTIEWPWLGSNGYYSQSKSSVHDKFHELHSHFPSIAQRTPSIITSSSWKSTCTVSDVRTSCISYFDYKVYITLPTCIGATFTKLAPTVHLDMIYWYHVLVCVLDLHFTLEVTIVTKKWLSLLQYLHVLVLHYHTCTKGSSWHDLLKPHGGLCPWPTFHTWVTMVRKKRLCLYYQYPWVLHSPNLHQLFYWCYVVVCVLDLHFTLS